MSAEERERWDARYRDGSHSGRDPSPVLTALGPWLPTRGRALDVAGGAGRHALWLAARGLEVTVVDISEEGLRRCRERAEEAGLPVRTLQADLGEGALPPGPWDLVLVHHFVDRELYPRLPEVLAPGGTLVIVHPTMANLERHPRPSARHLLEEGELERLVPGLERLRYREDWSEAGRHEAVLVARRALGQARV